MWTDNILDLIGNTPLVRLRGESIFCKAEFLNPGGSIKDRPALAMLEGAQRSGRLRPDSIIVEVIEVSDEDAIETARQLGRDLGLLVGISSGANVWAARQLAGRMAGNIGTVLPDRAERYFSTALL
jgi:cysteine synthase